MTQPAILALQDGSIFRGISIGADGQTIGEVVFNTAMTGYQEILTDPSYAQQIVTLTYPHIGNTGVNAEDVESDQNINCSVRRLTSPHCNCRDATAFKLSASPLMYNFVNLSSYRLPPPIMSRPHWITLRHIAILNPVATV